MILLGDTDLNEKKKKTLHSFQFHLVTSWLVEEKQLSSSNTLLFRNKALSPLYKQQGLLYLQTPHL